MGSEGKRRSLAREALCQIVAGGCAGSVEVSLMHPLDLVKTRFQVQKSKSSIAGTFSQIIRTEGPSSLYKGIVPALLQDAPKRATKFFAFEQYKVLFAKWFPSENDRPGAVARSSPSAVTRSSPNAVALAMAGVCAGVTEALIVTPFEVVKVRLQTETQVSLKDQAGVFSTARQIVAEGGYGQSGLYKGLTATLWRHGVFSGVYFGFYHNVKDLLPMYEDPYVEFLRKFAIGLGAGTFASCANIPFDVAKSRIQGPQPVIGQVKSSIQGPQPVIGQATYRTCFATIATVAKKEGVTALYRGLVPKVMRLGPGGAIMLLLYEYAYNYLEERFLK